MNYDYAQEDIAKILRAVGLKTGDSVFVHSNIGMFGRLKEAATKHDYFRYFIEAFQKVIGERGTLVIPTFSYSYCKGEVFNRITTPSTLGYFSEEFRKEPCSIRSEDPNFSVAAQGNLADYYTSYPSKYSFDGDCFWERFRKKEGVFCNLNFQLYLTYIIYVEHQLKVPYRFDKPFDGQSIKVNGLVPDTYYHFVYDLEKPETGPQYDKFSQKAVESRIAAEEKLGRGTITFITAENAFDFIEHEIEKDPQFLTRGCNGEG